MKENKEDFKIYLKIANDMASFSKCVSMQVGCIAVNERGRIIASGINGTPPGFKNCNDVHTCSGENHSKWSLEYEIHAEMNCIIDMAKSGSYFTEVSLFCTHSPCWNCLKHIAALNSKERPVKRIVFDKIYYKISPEEFNKQKEFCDSIGISLEQIV